MTEYFKKFTMDKDGVTVIDFGENGVFQCKYSDEAKSLCNRLNDLDYEKSNLKKENEQLKKEYAKLKHRHSLLHDECLDAECEKDSLKKDVESLEKENEQLKTFIKKNCPMCRCNLKLFYEESKQRGDLDD